MAQHLGLSAFHADLFWGIALSLWLALVTVSSLGLPNPKHRMNRGALQPHYLALTIGKAILYTPGFHRAVEMAQYTCPQV